MPADSREAYYQQRLTDVEPLFEDFDRSAAEVSLSLLYTCDLLSQCVSRPMSAYGLSRSTLNVLMILRFGPVEGMQLHDLGELMLVSKANITGLMNHLEQKEYVKRVVNGNDRRARFARITKKAEALLDRYLPVHYQTLKKLLSDLTDDEKSTLLHLLRKTRASLSSAADDFAAGDELRAGQFGRNGRS